MLTRHPKLYKCSAQFEVFLVPSITFWWDILEPRAYKRLSAEECIFWWHALLWLQCAAPFVSAQTSKTFAGIRDNEARERNHKSCGLCNRLDFCAAQAAYIFNKPSARLCEISFWDFGNAAVLNNESQRLEMAFINKSPCQRAAADR